MKKLLYIGVIPILLMACPQKDKNLKSGIQGQVLWLEGNQMPKVLAPGEKDDRDKPKGIQRSLYIYEPTTSNELEGSPTVYKKVNAKQIGVFETDEEGKFSIKLPPGTFSIFTKEEEGYFASTSDGKGVIGAVVVEKDQFNTLTIRVDYKAYY